MRTSFDRFQNILLRRNASVSDLDVTQLIDLCHGEIVVIDIPVVVEDIVAKVVCSVLVVVVVVEDGLQMSERGSEEFKHVIQVQESGQMKHLAPRGPSRSTR